MSVDAGDAAVACLLAFCALSFVDGVVVHLWRERLHRRPASRVEHALHTVRAVLFVPILVLFFGGAAPALGLVAIVVDQAVEIADMAVERRSRAHSGGLRSSEYVLHGTLITLRSLAIGFTLAGGRTASVVDLLLPGAVGAAILHVVSMIPHTATGRHVSELEPGCDLRRVATRIRPFVERRVARDDVDDVMQEILQRVHSGVDALDDDTRFVAWLHRVARNAIVDHHRREGRRDARHEAFVAEWRDEADEERDALVSLSVCVRAFVDVLPVPYREALRLTEIEGLTMREAADREAVSVSGMKSRVQRGRRLLRELFEACCEIALDARGRVVDYTPRPR